MAMRDLAEARAPLLLGSAASEALKAEVIDTMATIDPEAYRLGANSYVVKPVQFEAYLQAMRRLGRYWLELNQVAEGSAC